MQPFVGFLSLRPDPGTRLAGLSRSSSSSELLPAPSAAHGDGYRELGGLAIGLYEASTEAGRTHRSACL